MNDRTIGSESFQGIRMDRMEDIYDRSGGRPGEPHRHDYFTIVWVHKGNGTHLIDFTNYSLGENQMYFIYPGQIHHLVTNNRPQGCVISFTAEFLSANNISMSFLERINLFRTGSDSSPLIIPENLIDRFDQLFTLMYDLYESSISYRSEALGSLLKLVLVLSNEACARPETNHQHEQGTSLLSQFRNLVELNYSREHKVQWYAAALFITPKHLNAVVKNLLGQTAKEFIQDRIDTEARRLLLHTDLTVKEIAFRLGFSDPLHFSRYFKNHTGRSPSEFRI
jgi:AraC-like DNA-binding protein